MTGPIDAIEHAYFNMFKFSGRSTRSQFWWFALFYGVVSIYLIYLMIVKDSTLIFIWGLLNAMPNWTLTVRRLHDADKSGMWLLAGLLPFGQIAIYYFLGSPSDERENRFGPPALGAGGKKRAMRKVKDAQTPLQLERQEERKRIAHEYYKANVLGQKASA
jgi:uncharacterized membrane protein YhaH (DUF805 family)